MIKLTLTALVYRADRSEPGRARTDAGQLPSWCVQYRFSRSASYYYICLVWGSKYLAIHVLGKHVEVFSFELHMVKAKGPRCELFLKYLCTHRYQTKSSHRELLAIHSHVKYLPRTSVSNSGRYQGTFFLFRRTSTWAKSGSCNQMACQRWQWCWRRRSSGR